LRGVGPEKKIIEIGSPKNQNGGRWGSVFAGILGVNPHCNRLTDRSLFDRQ